MSAGLDPQFLHILIQGKSIKDDDNFPIDVTVPESYAPLPNLEDLPGHNTCGLKEVENYFTSLLTGEFRINAINVHYDDEVYNCDYCGADRGVCYYWCNECKLSMCLLCHSETSEAIALQNGAKNYHTRKDKLDKCHNHGCGVLEKIYDIDFGIICDLCRGKIKGSYFYTTFNTIHNPNNLFTTKDVCSRCYDTNQKNAQLYVTNHGLCKIGISPFSRSHMYFGSLLDWIPLYEDRENSSIVLMNLNPKSINFQKIALCSVDDHSRMGWFISNSDLATIVELIKELQPKFEAKFKDERSWEKHYSVPIKKIMKREGFPIHYG